MPSLGSIIPALGYLDPIIQDNTLVRQFHDALFPELLFRSDATPEVWEANVGDVQIFTRSSLLSATPTPLTPGVDPNPENPAFEQWRVKAAQYGRTMDTSMPASRTALAPLFARVAHTLGLSAGQELNRLARNRLYEAYLGGDTLATAGGIATVSIPVVSINGFTETIQNGQIVPVTGSATKTITIAGVVGNVTINAATPDSALDPFGPGILTATAPVTFAADAKVLASDASTILRAGGAPTVDSITPGTPLTLNEIRTAVAILRRNRVPTHPDGFYHVHMDPITESQIFSDNEMQRSLQSLPENYRMQRFVVGVMLGCIFHTNNESPNLTNVGTTTASRGDGLRNPEIHAEVRNKTGTNVVRTIVTGGGAIMEKYINEAEYMSEAGASGKIGMFKVVNNGIVVPIERVRYIIRAPQDRLQQIVSQSWSASLDFGIPSDLYGGQSGSRFKRAVVIESGTMF